MQETGTDPNWLLWTVEVFGGGVVVSATGWALVEWILARRAHKAREQQLDYLRNLLTTRRRSVLTSRDIATHELPPKLGGQLPNGISADALRAEEFNLMLRELGDALEYQTSELTPIERKEVRDALDWFHRPKFGNVNVVPISGKVAFPFVNSHRNPPHPPWVVENREEIIQPLKITQPLSNLHQKGYRVLRPEVYPVLHEGRWPVTTMTEGQAREKFEALRRLHWLALPWPLPRLSSPWPPLRDEG